MRKPVLALATAAAIVGAAGLSLTKTSEGKVNRTYLDPAGIVTACYGHTGPELRVGQRFTDAQCEAMLMADLAKHQPYVRPGAQQNCIGHAPLNQNQLDALTDFVFNVGPGNLCKSTLARRLKVQDYRGAASEFPKWNKARVNGKLTVLPGLVKRRTAEKRLFETPGPPIGRSSPSGPLRAILGMFN